MPPSKAGTVNSTTKNLLHLLPNYTESTLPKQIVDLSVSLYSTSKSRAAVLKKDEEIAREYACCVLAVERLKKPLNLPIDKLEPRPPCQPRVFERLRRFLDKAIPATSETPAKRRGRPPGSGKRKQEEQQIDPELSPEGSTKRRRPRKNPPNPNDLTTGGPSKSSLLRGVPRWLPKFLERIRPKLQEQMPEQAWDKILTDDDFMLSVIGSGVKVAREAVGETTTTDPVTGEIKCNDKSPSTVVAVLIVALQLHLGSPAVDVPKFAMFCARELAAGGVVKTTAFGAVVNDAQDLADAKRDEWQQSAWCKGEVNLLQQGDEVAAGEDEAQDVIDPALEQSAAGSSSRRKRKVTSAETEEQIDDDQADDGPVEVPRSRAGPMAQAHPDLLHPAKDREYKQWKAKVLKQAFEAKQQPEGNEAGNND